MTILGFATGPSSSTFGTASSSGSTNATYMRAYSSESAQAYEGFGTKYSLYFDEQTTLWTSGYFYNLYTFESFILVFAQSGLGALAINTNVDNRLILERYNGATWDVLQTSTGRILPTTNVGARLDVEIRYSSTVGEFRVYVDGALFVEFTGDVIGTSGRTAIDAVSYLGINYTSSRYTYWSEMFVSDYDTRTITMNQHAITGDGADTDMAGDYTDIDNLGNIDDATFINSTVANQISTFTHATSHPDFASQQILGQGVFSRTKTSVWSPINNVQLVLSDGTNDLLSENVAISDSYIPCRHVFLSPPDGGDWTIAKANATQAGVRSRD